jgi:hypothetical protein
MECEGPQLAVTLTVQSVLCPLVGQLTDADLNSHIIPLKKVSQKMRCGEDWSCLGAHFTSVTSTPPLCSRETRRRKAYSEQTR